MAELRIDLDVVARLAGAPVTPLEMPGFHGRSSVGRFRVGEASGALFGKRLEDATSYANEVASLRLLDGTGVAPGFRGSDDASRTFLMEDLGDLSSTADPYQHGTAEEAKAALLAPADALAVMHAATFRREREWLGLRPPAPPPPRFPRNERLGIEEFAEVLRTVGCEPGERDFAEMREVEASLGDPGPWLALTHGDPCPDNILVLDGRAIVIDFEFAWFRHALFDAVHPRTVFPTCWCANRVPEALLREFEARYRAGIVHACPPAADGRAWERNLGLACAGRLISSVGWLLPRALDEDQDWGIATLRQRFVPRLEAFVGAPAVAREFPALAALAERAIGCLRTRWTAAENELPVFAPFR